MIALRNRGRIDGADGRRIYPLGENFAPSLAGEFWRRRRPYVAGWRLGDPWRKYSLIRAARAEPASRSLLRSQYPDQDLVFVVWRSPIWVCEGSPIRRRIFSAPKRRGRYFGLAEESGLAGRDRDAWIAHEKCCRGDRLIRSDRARSEDLSHGAREIIIAIDDRAQQSGQIGIPSHGWRHGSP